MNTKEIENGKASIIEYFKNPELSVGTTIWKLNIDASYKKVFESTNDFKKYSEAVFNNKFNKMLIIWYLIHQLITISAIISVIVLSLIIPFESLYVYNKLSEFWISIALLITLIIILNPSFLALPSIAKGFQTTSIGIKNYRKIPLYISEYYRCKKEVTYKFDLSKERMLQILDILSFYYFDFSKKDNQFTYKKIFPFKEKNLFDYFKRSLIIFYFFNYIKFLFFVSLLICLISVLFL